MTIAAKLGWTDQRGYVPTVFAVTAFALGVQIALVFEAFGPASYPPRGKSLLAWSSASILAASAVLHVPWEGLRASLADLKEAITSSRVPRRAVHLAPYYRSRPETVGEEVSMDARTNGHEQTQAPTLEARVHSPLSAGPVVAPGEDVEFTIEAKPEHLARDLEVTVVVDGPTGTRSTQTGMPGTELTHTEAFDEPGEFTVTVQLDHPNADSQSKTLAGRVATYREEIGRLFEILKERAGAQGLDVGPGSTPREVCRELRKLETVDPGDLADLAVELEVALYGDDEVDRSTYETVHAAIASTRLLDDASPREVTR